MKTIEVLIPAHNEESDIAQTLQSIILVLEDAAKIFSFQFRISVGCNGCTDQTALIAKKYTDFVFEWPAIGKWKTLKKLSEQSQSDYLILVDSGTIWKTQFITDDFWQLLNSPKTLGVTLTYNPPGLSLIEKLYWSIESVFKKIEMKLGGLVAVSGMTVFYKADSLVEAFNFLETHFTNMNWLNDDVIIPIVLRFLNPSQTISLFQVKNLNQNPFIDIGLNKPSSEWNRRNRMMLGNLQWIRLIVPFFFKRQFISVQRFKILFILSRRILKVFWAYFGIFIFSTVLYLINNQRLNLSFLALGLIVYFLKRKVFNKIIFSTFASLKAPFDLLNWSVSSKNKSNWN